MDLRQVDVATRLRESSQNIDCVNLALGILKTYDLDFDSTNLKHLSHDVREKILYLYYNVTISIFYTDMRSYSLKIGDRLLLSKTNLPTDNISSNREFSVTTLETMLEVRKIDIPFDPVLIPETDENFRTLNPSICHHNGKYYLNQRCVNYDNDRCINFTAAKGSYQGKIVTRNFLLEMDSDFKLLHRWELIDRSDMLIKRDIVQGLEDVQLIPFREKFYFGCSSYAVSANGVDFCCGLFDLPVIAEHIEISLIKPLIRERVEKNWLPFTKDGQLYFIYSYQPFIILRAGMVDGIPIGTLSEMTKKNLSVNCALMRGSGGPIPYQNGYLVIIHEVIHGDDKGRMYLHRFLHFDSDWNLMALSLPFLFDNVRVQYCRSMCYSLDQKEILLGVGIEDKHALILAFNADAVSKILNPAVAF